MRFLPLCVGSTECLPRDNLTCTVAEEVPTLIREHLETSFQSATNYCNVVT